MACISLALFWHLFVWLVVICVILAVSRLVLRLIKPPADFVWLVDFLVELLRILLYAAIILAVGFLIFSLLACAFPLPFH